MTILQKKEMKFGKRNRLPAAVVCVLLLAFTAAGCGKAEEPIPVDLSSGYMEEIKEKDTGDAEDGSEHADAVINEGSDSSDQTDGNDDAENGSLKKDRTESEQEGAGSENDGAAVQENTTDGAGTQSDESIQLEGDVRSVSQDSFIAVRNETWVEGDASFMAGPAPGYEDEEDKVTVYVAENCVYQYKTVKNGGINPEDVSTREGSYADLQEGLMVSMQGNWQGDGSFLTNSIVMSTFQ